MWWALGALAVLALVYAALLHRRAMFLHRRFPRFLKALFNWHLKKQGDPGDPSGPRA
jgi:hypothetical protein